jgi:hypothetical protein
VENVDVRRAEIQLVLVAAAVASVGACRSGGSDAPACGAVGAKFLALAKDDLATSKVDETMRRAVIDQLPAMRDSLALACTEGKWTEAVRTCLVNARSHVEFEACEQQLTDAQRQSLDRAARGVSDESK